MKQAENAIILLYGMKLLKLLVEFLKGLSFRLESLKMGNILKTLFPEHILNFRLVSVLFS